MQKITKNDAVKAKVIQKIKLQYKHIHGWCLAGRVAFQLQELGARSSQPPEETRCIYSYNNTCANIHCKTL